MTDDELDRLADLIARTLIERHVPRDKVERSSWLPTPVRPEPPARGAEPPVWSGAAQTLADVAPGSHPPASGGHPADPSSPRVSIADLTRATRAAAAGRDLPSRAPGATSGRVARGWRDRAPGADSIEVSVGVSNRHVHLSAAHFRTLFGAAEPTSERPLSQPGQFAARETVDVVGPTGRIDKVRIVGPARGETQLELALSDAKVIGVTPPVKASGSLADSAGGVTLHGPAGSVRLERGVIVAARHLHLSPEDARRWGLHDGDLLDVRCGTGPRAATLHGVLVRSGAGHATELHLDADEARAVGLRTADRANIVGWRSAGARRRPLVTERDVLALARRGDQIPPDAILTPSARDRARAMRLLQD